MISATAAGVARIGPNSVIQTQRALQELEGPDCMQAVMTRAGCTAPLPHGMIPERVFVQVVRALRQTLPPEKSEAVLRRSGQYTAHYVARNRIPPPVRAILALLPARLGLPLLLKAFARNAWTFAGAGRFSVEGRYPGTLVLEGCPTSRPEAQASLECGCEYYAAAFEGLLTLSVRNVQVREVDCQAHGSPRCRFHLQT
jgi:divinyl protochlorophyllide a 8-vinyl-reductase